MNPEETLAEHRPGGAWKLAEEALKRGDSAEAERLCAFMVESDAKLMRGKIAKAV